MLHLSTFQQLLVLLMCVSNKDRVCRSSMPVLSQRTSGYMPWGVDLMKGQTSLHEDMAAMACVQDYLELMKHINHVRLLQPVAKRLRHPEQICLHKPDYPICHVILV